MNDDPSIPSCGIFVRYLGKSLDATHHNEISHFHSSNRYLLLQNQVLVGSRGTNACLCSCNCACIANNLPARLPEGGEQMLLSSHAENNRLALIKLSLAFHASYDPTYSLTAHPIRLLGDSASDRPRLQITWSRGSNNA